MKPEQFIREQGLDAIKDCIEEAKAYGGLYVNAKTLELSKHIPSYDAVSIIELMRLVESLDFINSVHGIDEAKELLREIDSEEWCYNLLTNVPIAVECAPSDDLVIHYAPLKQAIRDHESIYGGGDE